MASKSMMAIAETWGSYLDFEQETIKFKTIKNKEEEITFWEFPKKTLQEYISKIYNVDTAKQRELTAEEVARGYKPDEAPYVRIPYETLAETVDKLLYEMFSKASRGEKKPEYFQTLFEKDGGQVPFGVFAYCLEVLEKINHITAIAQTAGNWALLPESLKTAAAEEKKQAQETTTELIATQS